MATQQTTKTFCNHCREPFTLAALDRFFRCAACQKIPGVRGYVPTHLRGLANGGVEYIDKNPIPVIGGDEAPPAAATTSPAPAGTPSTWPEYQAIVRARSDLTNGDRVVFDALVRHADYKTGANCGPSVKKLAEELGWKPRRIKKYLHRLSRRLGLVDAHPLRSRRGWAQSLYRFTGHGFTCPLDCSGLKHLALSRVPRIAHDARGRFLGSRKPPDLRSRSVTVARVTERDRRPPDLGSRSVTHKEVT